MKALAWILFNQPRLEEMLVWVSKKGHFCILQARCSFCHAVMPPCKIMLKHCRDRDKLLKVKLKFN